MDERERYESDFIRFDVETGPSGGSRSDEREMSIFLFFEKATNERERERAGYVLSPSIGPMLVKIFTTLSFIIVTQKLKTTPNVFSKYNI